VGDSVTVDAPKFGNVQRASHRLALAQRYRQYARDAPEFTPLKRSVQRRLPRMTRRPVAELGRGKGAIYGLTPPPHGWRRVAVKARIAQHGTSDLAAARTHQNYIVRDGVTREGGPGQLYDREHNVADGGDFLERQKGDTYQFRLVVAPEDGGRMADLKPFVRDLMPTAPVTIWGPPPAYGRRPALSRWHTASATEPPRVSPEASSAENRGSRPIRVTVDRPDF
jgi:hypothetical protein